MGLSKQNDAINHDKSHGWRLIPECFPLESPLSMVESYNVRPPFDSVQLVQITPITMVYGTQITN